MDPSIRETEVKLRFDTASHAVERLVELGATEKRSRELEDNVVYDDHDDSLKASDRLLRLRRSGDRCVLTFKQRIAEGAGSPDARHKVREEVETRVGDFDAMRGILTRLGYRQVYRYQKYRTKYELPGVEVCIDETPLGCFVELEGRPDAIDAAAARLGFGVDSYITLTYHELHRQAAGDDPGDLLLPQSDVG